MVSKKVFFFILLIGKNRHGIGKKVATVALIWNRYERKAENPLKTESFLPFQNVVVDYSKP